MTDTAPTVVGLVAELCAEIRRLEDENERLRTACQEAVGFLSSSGMTFDVADYIDREAHKLADRLRAALKEAPPDGDAPDRDASGYSLPYQPTTHRPARHRKGTMDDKLFQTGLARMVAASESFFTHDSARSLTVNEIMEVLERVADILGWPCFDSDQTEDEFQIQCKLGGL